MKKLDFLVGIPLILGVIFFILFMIYRKDCLLYICIVSLAITFFSVVGDKIKGAWERKRAKKQKE